tara:strand:- start:2300 stop:3253 length:954 start_codon:yes stop_codon:yes gene_type:complete
MNRINELFGIKYPIIQGGMIWCSNWELASAVSNAGGLGLIGSGSMYPDILRSQIRKCKLATEKPFGVNIPLLYPDIEAHISIVIEEGVSVVFTSAGSPDKYTSKLQKHGIKVVHVIASKRFALKSVEAGVDAIVAEGFEAGGHNGVEEITTMCLIPMIKDVVNIPVIAAGGVASGRAMLAAIALGADAVQIGSRFIASNECSAHINFKNKVVNSDEGETDLTLKELTAVRLMKNKFYDQIQDAYANNASKDDLRLLLGRGRAKKGMFEGDLEDGELEVGQVSAMINKIISVEEIIKEITEEYELERKKIISLKDLDL